jgi:hypothetical protein
VEAAIPQGLEQRLATFFSERVVSDVAAEEYAVHLQRAWDALLCQRLSDLVDPGAIFAVIDGALERGVLSEAVFPVAAQLQRVALAELGADEQPLGNYVPEGARKKLDELLGRPGIVPEKLLRQVLEQDAVEELLRDTLYDALKEFNEKVNPFFADWGLAGVLKKLSPIGFGALSRSMENVRTEFDKRLDPEIRKFLQGFSRRALRKLADSAVARADAPKSVALRRALAAWTLEQPVREIVGHVGEGEAKLVHEIAAEVAAHVATMPYVRKRRSELLQGFLAEHGDRTVGELLARFGVTPRPDFAAIARATWPAVRAVLRSAPVRERIAQVAKEAVDAERASAGGA